MKLLHSLLFYSFAHLYYRFILANAAGSPRRRSSGQSSSGQSDDASQSHLDASSPGKQGSWRQKIFNRVVTPAKHPCSPTLDGKFCYNCCVDDILLFKC